MAETKRKTAKRRAPRRKATGRKRNWSAHVTETSHALTLREKLFQSRDPETIAASLRRSALRSRERKGTPLQSAMSMLNFYINRAGKNLPAGRRRTLNAAKRKLREQFGRAPG
ncbi:MAG: DUF3175 domain-containing protein [Dongiaceae bacterium]